MSKAMVMDDVSWMDRFSAGDLRELNALDARGCSSRFLADEAALSLALGLLREAMRRSGRWAGQLRFGRLCFAFVLLDRRDLQRQAEFEKYGLPRCHDSW